MILLRHKELYVNMRNEKLVFLVSTLRFGRRSYVISCAETDVCRNNYNKYNNFFGSALNDLPLLLLPSIKIVGHIIRRVSVGGKRFDDECRLAYIRVLHS